MSILPYYQNKKVKWLVMAIFLGFVVVAISLILLLKIFSPLNDSSEALRVPLVYKEEAKGDEDRDYAENVKILSSNEGNNLSYLDGYYSYVWDCGSTYEGEWRNNQMHGYGTMVWDCGTIYEGFWENSLMHGYGTLYYNNVEHYEGDFEKGIRHGYGQQVWFCGAHYAGEWAFDVPHGQGQLMYCNGDMFSGEFWDGYKHGPGVFTYSTGEQEIGDWEYNYLLR
jgi:hypothetical protein